MSYGFRIHHDNGRLLIDEDHPVYHFPRYDVSQSATTYSLSPGYPTQSVKLMVTLTFTFHYTVFAIAPPIMFIKQQLPMNARLGIVTFWNPYEYVPHAGAEKEYPDAWTSNIRWEPLGSPGAWTGVRVHLADTTWDWSAFSGRNAPFTIASALSLTPDFRHSLVPVVAGASPPKGVGIGVWDAQGRPVFHSNDNMLVVTNTGSDWNQIAYIRKAWSHDDGLIYFFAVDESTCAATSPNDLLMVTPRSLTRRAEGATAYVALQMVATRPRRLTWFGRWDDGGAIANTTTLWARPMHPLRYNAI